MTAMLTIPLLLLAALLALFMAAASWPLLSLPLVRRAMVCAGGSCCLGCGVGLFAILAGSLAIAGEPAVLADGVTAAEPAAATAEQENAAASSAPGSQSGGIESALPAEAPASLSEDPQIESDQPTLVIPPGRPAWVETDLNETGIVHTLSVTSEPRHSKVEAHRRLDEALVRETSQYIADHLGSPLAAQFIHYDARAIKQRLVKPENFYDETLVVSIGPMHQSHALLEFSPEFRQEIDKRWAQVRATSRLTQLGLFSGAALLLLGSVFGYFRLDNATRGYYTGRLQFMTAAAILAVVGAGVVLARWITWM